MNPDRWRLIEDLFHEARERPKNERARFLTEACGDDAGLRAEVEELLRADEGPATEVSSLIARAAASFSAETPADLSGTSLGPFRVLRRVGSGGMGTVYLAVDSRLGRQVALKVLPESFRSDSERLRRFEQEARTASALNHPNIITIHEVEKAGNLTFIVTEFVEGETLGARIHKSALSIGQIADIGAQVADALHEAHRMGIVHRDVKPGNIMITQRGAVKVLDFGLAKMFEPGVQTPFGGEFARTATGMILGTVQYMSPEQAAGRELDHRSDLFSLGVVLYEMTTNHLPFDADSTAETLQKIATLEPEPLTHFRKDVPWELERIVRKCLEKQPATRYQSAAEIGVDLRNLTRSLESGDRVVPGSGPAASSSAPRARALAALLAGTVALASLAWWFRDRLPGASAPSPPTFNQLTSGSGEERMPTLSPDGTTVVFMSGGDLFLQRVGGTNPINLTSDSAAYESAPAFSPDGSRIAFRSDRDDGGIFVMGATGESVRRVTDFGFNPGWSPDGKRIVVASEGVEGPFGRTTTASQLWIIDVETGARNEVKVEDGVQPSWSPHGSRLAYWANRGGQRDLWTVPVSGGKPAPVTSDRFTDWNPVWAPDGRHLYFSSDRGGSMNIWRVRIDEDSGAVKGEPEPVAIPSKHAEHLSFSRDGKNLAYVDADYDTNIQAFSFDPATTTAQALRWITQGSRPAEVPGISRDGKWITYSGEGDRQEDVFVVGSDGSGLRQVTDDPNRDRRPTFSPDGSRITFYSDRTGTYEIWGVRPDGSQLERITYMYKSVVYPKWAPDGSLLSFCLLGGHTYVMEPDKPVTARPLPPVPEPDAWFIAWSWSPDSSELAGWLGTNRRAHGGILVYSFATKRYRTLTETGAYPYWLSDGRRLIFSINGEVHLLDTQSGTIRRFLSVAPDRLDGCVAAPDDRTIYCTRSRSEADVWLMRTN